MTSPQTSAALYNLVLRAAQDLCLLGDARNPVHGEAQVPHAQKGSLLALVCEQAGAEAILDIGPRLLSYQSVLAIAVLTRASDPLETIRRWQRLERIYHSHHRIVLREQTANSIIVRHEALDGPPPKRLDDLLIAGIVTALLAHQGCTQLVGSFVDGEVFTQDGERCLGDIDDCGDSSTWAFSWSGWKAVGVVNRPSLSAVGGLTGDIADVFATDPAHGWTLRQFSARCGMSERTLQRRLAKEGSSLQALLRELRAKTAANLLEDDSLSIADVAFACGYADQPHLSREFRRCIGMTPGHYREILSDKSGGAV